jgi:hypothetical protein
MDSSKPAAAARQPWRFGSIILALALLTGAAACAYGFFAWNTVSREESQRLENLARVAGRSATLFYSQFGIALGDLGEELADEPGNPPRRRLQQMLDRTRSHAPALRLVGILGPDGELLSISSALPGKLDPAELAFPTAENLRTVRTRYALEVGRPVQSAHFGEWMIPLRHVIRHPSGKARLTLFALASFDDQATVFGDLAVPNDWVIGILRNDRYFQGRWPASANPVDVYARPFTGPIERWQLRGREPDHRSEAPARRASAGGSADDAVPLGALRHALVALARRRARAVPAVPLSRHRHAVDGTPHGGPAGALVARSAAAPDPSRAVAPDRDRDRRRHAGDPGDPAHAHGAGGTLSPVPRLLLDARQRRTTGGARQRPAAAHRRHYRARAGLRHRPRVPRAAAPRRSLHARALGLRRDQDRHRGAACTAGARIARSLRGRPRRLDRPAVPRRRPAARVDRGRTRDAARSECAAGSRAERSAFRGAARSSLQPACPARGVLPAPRRDLLGLVLGAGRAIPLQESPRVPGRPERSASVGTPLRGQGTLGTPRHACRSRTDGAAPPDAPAPRTVPRFRARAHHGRRQRPLPFGERSARVRQGRQLRRLSRHRLRHHRTQTRGAGSAPERGDLRLGLPQRLGRPVPDGHRHRRDPRLQPAGGEPVRCHRQGGADRQDRQRPVPPPVGARGDLRGTHAARARRALASRGRARHAEG